MSIEIKVPQLPESVSDATLVAWHKKAGDAVERDENLVDLETDKVVLEVPAPSSGTLSEIRIKDGATVTAGDVLAILDEGAGAAAGQPRQNEAAAGGQDDDDAGDRNAADTAGGDGGDDSHDDDDTDESADDDAAAAGSSARKLSPSVRRLLQEHDLDVGSIRGSGKDGRVTKADVMKYLKSHSDEDVTPGDAPAPDTVAGGAQPSRTEQRVAMTRLRARIAERMVSAQQTAAMLTTFNEIDLTKVISLRKRYKETFEREHGVRLGFMSFFARAAVEALKKFPVVNASVED
ncbi:MAG TPA: 2-oxo acid dehydrogenase subunit E2, partial [Woeseiaceae bacterium]|nr:2-oxo acid dehydrogenase subunit E2 [Woeseiaceae bacterium]